MTRETDADGCTFLFIEGYIESRYRRGDRPTRGYPADGGLPHVYVESEVIESSIVAALRSRRAREAAQDASARGGS